MSISAKSRAAMEQRDNLTPAAAEIVDHLFFALQHLPTDRSETKIKFDNCDLAAELEGAMISYLIESNRDNLSVVLVNPELFEK